MSLTEKEIYDLNNRNVASQNVQLGTILSNQSGNALTEKQIYDLTNDNVITQEVEFGKIVNAIATGDMTGIDNLTEEQQKALNNIDVSFQNVELGTYIEDIIEGGEPPVPTGDYFLTFKSKNGTQFNTYTNVLNLETSEMTPGISWDGTIEYSTDKENWNVWDGTSVSSSVNGEIYFRGTSNTCFSDIVSSSILGTFIFDIANDTIAIEGNIENLLDYQEVELGNHPPMADDCFEFLFGDIPQEGRNDIEDASKLVLGGTTLASRCYTGMFYFCTSLTTAPALPATTLAEECYGNMFEGCTSLTTAPALPATTLSNNCYSSMFNGCTSLTSVPALPATTLAENCYDFMFGGCTSLIALPSDLLPATTLAEYCYTNMFIDCYGITTLPSGFLPATVLAVSCYGNMFERCTSLITLPSDLLPATTLAESCYNSMFTLCESLETLPQLPSTILADACYYRMFQSCSKIKLSTTPGSEYINEYRIPATGTGTDANSTMTNMFYGTGGTFIGTPSINTTYYTSNEVV